ncbi:MAG: lamin tail domain-containing protein [Myxococcota bacterium]|jgi:hypothetical protein|nr:lamin tail domain-containing protein [Myxococcota bacterium]
MRHKTLTLVAWFLLLGSCLDIELLDEMQSWSTDSSEIHGQPGSDEGMGSGADDEYIPQPDPSDVTAPSLTRGSCVGSEQSLGLTCAVTGPYSLSLRFGSGEPAIVRLQDAPLGLELRMLSKDYATQHHAIVAVAQGPGPVSLALAVTDASGNATALELACDLPPGPGIAITEILADPLGPEPDQEFVEVANLAQSPIDLSGWMIDDNADRNGDVLPQGSVLSEKGVALIVGPQFDPSAAGVPATTPLLSLASSLGSAGLRNAPPESVELYDKSGALVSAYPGLPDSPGEGRSAVRAGLYVPDGAMGAFVPEPNGAATPGRASP